MGKNDEKRNISESSLFRVLTSELKGKQSVRATFRLTGGCIDAISIVAAQMGIKQKSLFDHLAEDVEALETIAQKIKNTRLKNLNRIQKTFVISRRSLSSLDEISRMFNAPRDALIEYSVQRLLPFIDKERKKHEKRKELFLKIKKHFQDGEKIRQQIKKQLGDDDPMTDQYEITMSGYEAAKYNIESFIERSKNIENFDFGE